MRFYLAPMEGITTHIYRNAFHRHYGGVDCYYTPFLANYSFSARELRDILPENNQDMNVIPQILTNQAETFLAIAKGLQSYGYKEVNLNLGCPSKTVTTKKRGAGFLSVPDRLDSFLDEIFEKCPLDISIKTRIGIEAEYEWADLLAIYQKYPLKELIIHPRYQKELYNGAPHVEAFRMATDLWKESPIALCYNGDITSAQHFHDLLKKVPSTEAVMIGRGALANPELFQILRSREAIPPFSENLRSEGATLSFSENLRNENSALPSSENLCNEGITLPPDKKRLTFQAFHDEILMGYMGYMSGDQPVLFKMKELWNYMRQYAHITDSMLKKIRKAKRISEYRSLVQVIFAGM